MKLSFKQKNILRLTLLILILFGIFVFIYYELKKDNDFINLNNIETELSSNAKPTPMSVRNVEASVPYKIVNRIQEKDIEKDA